MNNSLKKRSRRNRLILGSLTALLVSSPLFSAESSDSIPVDVASILLAELYSPAKTIYSDVMDGFPPLAFAPDFTVLGSTEMRRTPHVMLRAALDWTNAEAALTRVFEASGWQRHEDSYSGFNNSRIDSIPPVLQFCSDEWGTSSVQIHSNTAETLVDVTWYSWEPGGYHATCDEIASPPPPGFVHPDLPRLALPQDNPVVTPVYLGPGGRGYAADWQTDARVEIDWPLAQMLEHFMMQLRSQEWDIPISSNGEFLASASTTKMRADNTELRGLLTLLELSPGIYEVRFRLLTR